VTASGNFPTARLPRAAGCIGIVLALLLAAVPAGADARSGSARAAAGRTADGRHGRRSGAERRRPRARHHTHRRRRVRARRSRARRLRHARQGASISSATAVARVKPKATAAAAPASETLEAGFEDGLANWNTAGVGEAVPTVVGGEVRSGLHSGRVVLTGTQHRSELILGGDGGDGTDGMVEFHEGDEYFYGFSFCIDSMVYGHPGAHNLIMQFKGDDEGSPSFGLQLWDYEGDDGEYAADPKGLWSHGPSMGGDRFLAPVAEHVWHDVVIHFKASSTEAGFYELFLDGRPIDARGGVSMIAPGASYAYIKDGLYRNGDSIPGTSEIHLDDAKLGRTWDAVQPG
jgi:Polysaccharide lyase